MNPKQLNPKQERFCQEYAVDLNGAQAAIRAGYAPTHAKVPSRPGEFHPEPLTEPDVILSHHPAHAIA